MFSGGVEIKHWANVAKNVYHGNNFMAVDFFLC